MREANERERLTNAIVNAMRQAGHIPEMAVLEICPMDMLRRIHSHWTAPGYAY